MSHGSPLPPDRSVAGVRAPVGRPFLTTPRRLPPDTARQPALGLAGGLVFVVPFVALLAFGVGGANGSVRVLGPLTTFALPLVAMVGFWWEDWPGTRLRPAWAGWADTLLIAIGAFVLTAVGQAVTARFDLAGIVDPHAGPAHAATFPITMPLAGAAFVAMLQLTLACERWPLSHLGRQLSGLIALAGTWIVALVVVGTVVDMPPVGGARAHSGLIGGADFGAVLVTAGMWQALLFVVLRGWPLNLIGSRAARLAANNAAVVAGTALTYGLLSAVLARPADTISAVCGCVIAGGLLVGMLFEGWPPRAGRAGVLALTAIVSAALFVLLSALSAALSWERVTAADWVAYVGLNAIGLPVILHVAIGQRWPFQHTSAQQEAPS